MVHNAEADEGLASSIRCGVRAVQARGDGGVVIMTCDQPGLTPQHLAELMAEPERTTASAYAGRAGVPAYFCAQDFAVLLALRGDVGARELLRGARQVRCEALALDVDTEADVERAAAMLRDEVR